MFIVAKYFLKLMYLQILYNLPTFFFILSILTSLYILRAWSSNLEVGVMSLACLLKIPLYPKDKPIPCYLRSTILLLLNRYK